MTAPSESVSVQAGETFEDQMIVANTGDSVLSWTADCPDCEDDSGGKPHRWLTLIPNAAEVLPNESVSVRVLYDTTGLAPGTYSGTIDVASNDPVTPDVLAPVDLNVVDSCETFLRLSYPDAPSYPSLGDTVEISLSLGAGRIGGGTMARIHRVRFNLDCDFGNVGLNCPDDGTTVSYQGQISSTCGVEWDASSEPGDVIPNQIVLTPRTPLEIPSDTPEFCTVRFLTKIEHRGNGLPDLIFQTVGLDGALLDAECDNTPPLPSETAVGTGQICLAPLCDDGNQCNGSETFDQVLGCVPGTPLACDDADACTIDTCDPDVLPPDDPCLHDPDPSPACGGISGAPRDVELTKEAGSARQTAGVQGGSCTRDTTCESIAQLAYQVAHGFNSVGDTLRPVIRLGASHLDGNTLSINRVRFDLNCDSGDLDINCFGDSYAVSYQGNLTTNCGVTFTSSHVPGDTIPNQVVFAADPPLVLLSDSPDFCSLAFDVRIETSSHDGTPDLLEQIAGMDANLGDAVCSTIPPRAGGSISLIRLKLCPACDDGDPCNGVETCDERRGCIPGTPTDCDDHNDCTSDGCIPQTGECTHAPLDGSSCSDGDACTVPDRCASGACVGGPAVTCNDGNACTVDACTPDAGCLYVGDGSCEESPKGQGYWKRLCSGREHRGEFMSEADLACSRATLTFASTDSVASVCRIVKPHVHDACARADVRFMSLILNLCRQRLSLASAVQTDCGAFTVGEIESRVDAILSDSQRNPAACQSALCYLDGIDGL